MFLLKPTKYSSNIFPILLIILFISAFSLSGCSRGSAGKNALSTIELNGQLKVVGSQLCNQNGDPIQLKGMSSHGLQWFGHYMNYDSIKFMRDDWGANLVRAAMYTSSGGYISNPKTLKTKVKEVVQAAIDLDIYVIIDWHILSDGDPNTYKEQAKAFFQEMASLYKDSPNVIYEICNEPNGDVTWDRDIKPYAEYIIPAIRDINPNAIIIVGTSTWSQDIHHAADDPLEYDNIMYACHFYAGTHTQWLRDRIDYAMSKGAAIFVTEWGTSEASGTGGPFLEEAKLWVDYMEEKKISWANWSLCDKTETSAALRPGSNPSGNWTDDNLTASGLFVKHSIKNSSNKSTKE
jgi:endoglucanase